MAAHLIPVFTGHLTLDMAKELAMIEYNEVGCPIDNGSLRKLP